MIEPSALPGLGQAPTKAALAERPSRSPDHAAEASALRALATILAERPQELLQSLADLIVTRGWADSAGVGLLHDDGCVRIEAAAGAWASLRGAAAADPGPCGAALAAKELLLIERPQPLTTAAAESLARELLMVPLQQAGRPAGVLWAALHRPERDFDREDARLLHGLARMAEAGQQVTRALAASQSAQQCADDRIQALFDKAEGELRERESRLAAIFATAPVGLSEVSPEGRFLRVNAELCRILGRSEAEMLRLTVADVSAPEDVPPSLRIVGEVMRTGKPSELDKRYRQPDGSLVWANSRVSRLDAEAGGNLLVATVDLSARRRAETALRTSEERLASEEQRLRLALEVGRLATWDWDPVTGAVAWNDEHYRMQGYAVGEVEPSFENWAARVHPEDLRPTVDAIERARVTGDEYVREFRNLLPGGEIRWCSARGRFFYDERGSAVRMIGVMEDVTEARQAQDALAESERRLRLMLAELQHRVRNSLGIVRSIARRTAETSETVDDMIAHLLGRLEAFSRVQGAVTRDPSGGVDLTGLIEDELLAHATREGRQLSLKGPKLLLTPRAAESISLALHELTTNAVKHGALSGKAGQIDVRWQQEDGRVSFVWKEFGLERTLCEPDSEGFGMELLLRSLPYDLNAETAVSFEPGGLRFTLSAAADTLLQPRHP